MARILIVDDEIIIRELLQEVLEPMGHAVEMAENGMDGLTRIREGSFDLAILDINMPVLSGLELLRLIRRDAKHRKMPVLMCTANKMTYELNLAFEAGASGYIMKPFELQKVSESVTKALAAPHA